jgi:hypothetical protein
VPSGIDSSSGNQYVWYYTYKWANLNFSLGPARNIKWCSENEKSFILQTLLIFTAETFLTLNITLQQLSHFLSRAHYAGGESMYTVGFSIKQFFVCGEKQREKRRINHGEIWAHRTRLCAELAIPQPLRPNFLLDLKNSHRHKIGILRSSEREREKGPGADELLRARWKIDWLSRKNSGRAHTMLNLQSAARREALPMRQRVGGHGG